MYLVKMVNNDIPYGREEVDIVNSIWLIADMAATPCKANDHYKIKFGGLRT